MKLINTDGMALIGPGSEWFWTALSGIVLAVTFLAIYRQLRAQGAANAVQRMEALQGRWESPRMIHARLIIAIWRKHIPAPSPDFETQAALNWLGGFFEDLYDLEEAGHLTLREIANNWGQLLPRWWVAFGPAIQELRPSSPTVFNGFERIARRAETEGRRRAEDWSVSESQFQEFIDAQIGRNSARLRMLRDIETGVIPTVRPQGVPETAKDEIAPSSPQA